MKGGDYMKKKKSIIVLSLLLLIGLSVSLVASTYAKYTSELPGKTGTATIAKWAFVEDNATETFNIDLAGTYDPTTLVANRIAPGTMGSFNIGLSNEHTETAVQYTITIGDQNNVPANLKFYSDAARTQDITYNGSVTGVMEPNQTTGAETIYWAWAYETTDGDEADTESGNDAYTTTGSETMTVGVNITGVQVQPTINQH